MANSSYPVYQNARNRALAMEDRRGAERPSAILHDERFRSSEFRRVNAHDLGKEASVGGHSQTQQADHHHHLQQQHLQQPRYHQHFHQHQEEQCEPFHDYTNIGPARNKHKPLQNAEDSARVQSLADSKSRHSGRKDPSHMRLEPPHSSRGESLREDSEQLIGNDAPHERQDSSQHRGHPAHTRDQTHHDPDSMHGRHEAAVGRHETEAARNGPARSEQFLPTTRHAEREEHRQGHGPVSPLTRNLGLTTSNSLHRHSGGSRSASAAMMTEGNSDDGARITASTFDQIREENVRKRTKFEDKAFLPNDLSLYFSRHPPYRIEWKRPWDICQPHRPNFVTGGFDRTDVRQGSLGDCWFVAAMACLCGPDNYPLLERIIPQDQGFKEGWYAGMFRFNFWHFGEWREVVVDDLLPVVEDRGRYRLIFVNSSDRTEFWPALMEKAYAKLYGSYEALKGGWMADSLTDLTGGVSEVYVLRGERRNYPPNILTILMKALERHALIGCGIDEIEGAGPEAMLENGLVTGHAYSVTDLKRIFLASDRGHDPVYLIRIRNPHGDYKEWRGMWRDGSEKWRDVRAEDLDQLGLVRREDGEFWMDFQDFLRNFDELVICNLSPDAPVEMPRKWFVEEHHGRWVKHFNAGGRPRLTRSHWANPQYVLRLDDTDDDDDKVCSVIIQLMQKDRRKIKQKGEHYHFIGFVIYRVPQGYSFPLKKDFFEQNQVFEASGNYINTRQIVKRFSLPPGVYVVVPCTYEVDKEADYFIRFFFEKGNVSEYADEPPAKVEVPPPTPFPKQKDQEEEFKRFFYKMSGEDMEVDPFELQKAVNEGLRKEPLHRDIGVDACKSFVSLMDVDNSGRLGFTEFQFLWSHLRSWKKTFLQHDADNSGKMDSRELRTALASVGYRITNRMLAAMIFRYADAEGQVSLDDFLVLMAHLMKLFDVFHKRQRNGQASFSLQEWVEESLLI